MVILSFLSIISSGYVCNIYFILCFFFSLFSVVWQCFMCLYRHSFLLSISVNRLKLYEWNCLIFYHSKIYSTIVPNIRSFLTSITLLFRHCTSNILRLYGRYGYFLRMQRWCHLLTIWNVICSCRKAGCQRIKFEKSLTKSSICEIAGALL